MRRPLRFLSTSFLLLLGSVQASSFGVNANVSFAPWTLGYAPLISTPFYNPLDTPGGTAWSAQWTAPEGNAFVAYDRAIRGISTVNGNGTVGPYPLSHRHVVFESVSVRLSGVVLLSAGADYVVDADAGTMTLTHPLPRGASLSVSYEYRPAPGAWLVGGSVGRSEPTSGWRASVTTDARRANISGGYRWSPLEEGRWSFDVGGGFGVQPDVLDSVQLNGAAMNRWSWGDAKLEFSVRRPGFRPLFTDGRADQTRAAGTLNWRLDEQRQLRLVAVRDQLHTLSEKDPSSRVLQEYAAQYLFEVPELGAVQFSAFRKLDETRAVDALPRRDNRTGVGASVTGFGVLQGWRFGVDAARRDDASMVYGANVGWLARLGGEWSGDATARVEGTAGTTSADAFAFRLQPNVAYRFAAGDTATVGGQFEYSVRGGREFPKGFLSARYVGKQAQVSLTRAFPTLEAEGSWIADARFRAEWWRVGWQSNWSGLRSQHSLQVGARYLNLEPYALGLYSPAGPLSFTWETGVRWGALMEGNVKQPGWLGTLRVYGAGEVLSGGLDVGYAWNGQDRLQVSTSMSGTGRFGVRLTGEMNAGGARVGVTGAAAP